MVSTALFMVATKFYVLRSEFTGFDVLKSKTFDVSSDVQQVLLTAGGGAKYIKLSGALRW